MRGDFELALMRYTPDAVLTAEARARVRLDFKPSYRGRDGVRAFIETYQDAFDQSYEPKWLVNLGDDLFVMLVQHSLRGRASGVKVEQVSPHRPGLSPPGQGPGNRRTSSAWWTGISAGRRELPAFVV